MYQDETWHTGRPRPWSHCVRWAPSSPLPKGHSPLPSIFRPYLLWPMARWIKMPLGMEVSLGPGDFVLDGFPAHLPPKRGHSPPISSPCLLWPNGWIDQDTTWYGGRLRPRRHCIRWGRSSSSPQRGTASQFSAHVYRSLAKRLDGSRR